MSDDVEIGIDGSGAESGVSKIVNSLGRIGKASEDAAKTASANFQKIYDKLKNLGESGTIARYEKMTGAMERAAKNTAKSSTLMSQSITANAAKSAASIDRMTSSLARLESFKGPNKAAVRNVTDLLGALAATKSPAGLGRITEVSSVLGNFKGPSGASVKNTQELLGALSATKLSSTITRLTVLDSISNFKGPSSKSVDNTERLLGVLSRTRIASGSLSEAAGLLNALGNAGGRLGATTSRANAANGALQRLGGSSRQGATGLKALADQADKTNQALYHTERFFGTIANVAGLSFVAGEIQKWDSSAASIQTVTNNIAATTSEMGFLVKAAKENSTYIGSLTKGYSSFRTAASGAGLALKDTQSLFYGVTRASRVYNLSLDDQEGVYRALTQIMGKNSLQQEELRGQLGDRMPVAIQAMALALGKTIPEMNEMTKKGQVTGKVLTDAFSKLGPILQNMTAGGFTAAMDTIGAKVSNLRTEATLLSVAMGEAGLKKAITNVLGAVSNLITEGGPVYGFLMNISEAALFLSENLDAVLAVSVLSLIGKFNLFSKTGDAAAKTMATLQAVSSGSAAGWIATERAMSGTARTTKLFLDGLGEVGPASDAASRGLNSVSSASGTLMRVSSGRQIAVMSSTMGLLAKGARLAVGPVTALLSAIGLTNPWLIAAAAVVGVVLILDRFSESANKAREAQKNLAAATKLGENASFSGAAAMDVYAKSLSNASDELRRNTLETLRNNTARAVSDADSARKSLTEFASGSNFRSLPMSSQEAINRGLTSNNPYEAVNFLNNGVGDLQTKVDNKPGLLRRAFVPGETSRMNEYAQGLSNVQTLTRSLTTAAQGTALQMYLTGTSFEDIQKKTGMTADQLKMMGIGLEQTTQSTSSLAKGADGARNRIVPLTMSLEDYVRNLDSVRQAQLLLNAVSPPGEDMGVVVTGYAAIQDRIQALTLEQEALKLGQDTWERYRQSVSQATRRGLESNFADQIASERAKGKTGTKAQELLGAAVGGVQTIWESQDVRSGPVGAERVKALRDITNEYEKLGDTMQEYQERVYLVNQAELSTENRVAALAQARRSSILQFREALGVQGNFLAAFDDQANKLRTLNQLSENFGIDVDQSKVEVLRQYAIALREIYEATPEGRIQARLRDNLTSIAEGAASSLDTLFNTVENMRRFEETVLRPQLLSRNGFIAGGDAGANAKSTSLTDAELNARRTEASLQRSADQFQSYVSAINSSIDSVGDTFTDFIMGAEVNIADLGLSITRELTKAFLIQPMMDKLKSGLGSLMANSPMGGFLGMANAAASGATGALETGNAAALTAAATSLSGSGIAITTAVGGLTAATAPLGAAGVGLNSSALALGGAASALGLAAGALGASATASTLSNVGGTASTAISLISKFGPMIGLPMFHSGGIVGSGIQSSRMVSPYSGLERYHTGGLGGLKSREVGAVLKIGEEVLPENSPRHINNIGKFDGPTGGGSGASYRGGDTYDINVTVQAPQPTGNPAADRRAQEDTAKVAAEALDAVIKNRTDRSKRERSMKVQ